MAVEPIGLITILVGLSCIVFGPAMGTPVFASFTLLGAAAAVILTAIGGATIQPAHLLLMFLFFDLATRPALLRYGLAGLRFPRAGGWLLLTVVYGVATAIIMPRLFAGAAYVFTPARSDSGAVSILTVPLGPGNANLTQSIYFIGDLICFVVIATHAGRQDAPRQITRAMIGCGALNLVFAGIDLSTYYTNTAENLAFIRNSSYRMLDDVETAGLKRIVGSFTEAAVFAYATLGLLGLQPPAVERGYRLTGNRADRPVVPCGKFCLRPLRLVTSVWPPCSGSSSSWAVAACLSDVPRRTRWSCCR